METAAPQKRARHCKTTNNADFLHTRAAICASKCHAAARRGPTAADAPNGMGPAGLGHGTPPAVGQATARTVLQPGTGRTAPRNGPYGGPKRHIQHAKPGIHATPPSASPSPAYRPPPCICGHRQGRQARRACAGNPHDQEPQPCAWPYAATSTRPPHARSTHARHASCMHARPEQRPATARHQRHTHGKPPPAHHRLHGRKPHPAYRIRHAPLPGKHSQGPQRPHSHHQRGQGERLGNSHAHPAHPARHIRR